MNIDLTEYRLVQPSDIKKIKQEKIMYDIVLKKEHTFFIFLDDYTKILVHNCDGHHISSLLINLFHRWFPHVIEGGKLFKLVTPLVVCDDGKQRKYFQTLEEFESYSKDKKLSGINYLKGLGSLNENDWDYVMKNKILFQINKDRSSDKFLEIAFGESSLKRKKFLEGK
jgi:DNA gyrase/topoisomerase IV subunit B